MAQPEVREGGLESRKGLMARSPLVSVCIPSFNHARFLPAAIESVLAQTYSHIELVIVDDSSTDESLEVAQRYALRHPERVKVFVHEGNARRGTSATANLAFEKSSGDYWCGLSSDDAFVPDKVERQVMFLEQHPQIGILYGRPTMIDESGRAVGQGFATDLSHERDPLRRLLEGNCIYGQTTMIRRECFEKVGLHDETLMYSDWELWVRIVAHYKIAFLPRPVTYYRIHTTNTSIGQPPEIQLERHLEVMKALERKAPAIGGGLALPFSKAVIQLQLAYLYFCASARGAAARAVTAAYEIDPSAFCDVWFLAGWLRRRQGEVTSFMRSPAPDFLPWFAEQTLPRASMEMRWRLRFAMLLAKGGIGARQLRRHARRRQESTLAPYGKVENDVQK